MLNELFELHRSMEAVGITRNSRFNRYHCDDHYKECGKNKGFFLLINGEGDFCRLEPIKDMQNSRFRKYEVGSGISFPVLNVEPLLHARSAEARDAVTNLKRTLAGNSRNADKLRNDLYRLWEVCNPLWGSSKKDKINKSLNSAGLRTKLGAAIERIPDDCSAFAELMSRCEGSDADKLQESIKSLVIERLLAFPENANLWIDALLVSASPAAKASIVLELEDQSSFAFPATHEKVVSWVNTTLMQIAHPSTKKRESSGIDAFGLPINSEDFAAKFPSVILPEIGEIKLRAMSHESPCQKRYGRIDANSFPAGAEGRQAMKAALVWLKDESRKGKTWARATGACGYTKGSGKKKPIPGLFLVYPTSVPDDPPELAGAFCGEDDASDADGVKFEAAAESVTAALKIMLREKPDVEIRILVLVKADRGRKKIVVTRKLDPNAFISGAAAWSAGCNNIPEIFLNVGSETKPEWLQPIMPFPADAARCANIAWLESGKRADFVHGIGIGDGIELLLDSGRSALDVVYRVLSHVIRNAAPIMLTLGQADHRRDGRTEFDRKNFKYARMLPPLLGLLLYKLNLTKGAYMHTAPFLAGRLMALADILHKEYCRLVRDGDIPRQLIGNALMATVVENPVRGLARLCERMMIYQSWANTTNDDKSGLAKWALGQIGSIANELCVADLSDHANDADKAQIMLGYLSRVEKPTKKTNDPNIDDPEVSNVP